MEKYKSPIERMLKKNFEDMTAKELKIMRIVVSLVVGILFTLAGFLIDKPRPLSFRIFVFLLSSICWYFMFWGLLLKHRGFKK